MIYFKLDESMNLVNTVNEPIYRGDMLYNKIIFLVPECIGDIDTKSATVYLSYIRADGTADIALLSRMDNMYKDKYYQYTLPITSAITKYAGEICAWMQIFAGSARDPMIAKSGECIIRVMESQNMDEHITDKHLRLIYEMQKHMEDLVEKTEESISERIDGGLAAKADNIMINEDESTIQLVSTSVIEDENGDGHTVQTVIGDAVYVRTDKAKRHIVGAYINDEGDLIMLFDDGTTQDLGTVVSDGKHTSSNSGVATPPDGLDEDVGRAEMEEPITTGYTWGSI